MSDGNVAFEKGDGVLNIVLTAPSRLSYMRICVLLSHLLTFGSDPDPVWIPDYFFIFFTIAE